MAFELQDVINDPDLAESYTILRNPGNFALGGWQPSTQQSITAWGVVTVATQKELQMIPEADRIIGARMFFCEFPIYVTDENRSITSDILMWKGQQYRVMSVAQYENRGGYYCAIAVRMFGA